MKYINIHGPALPPKPHTHTHTHTHTHSPDGLRFSAEILSHDDKELDLWLHTLKEIINSGSPAPGASAGKKGKSRSFIEKGPP